jgi:hypothetical protein
VSDILTETLIYENTNDSNVMENARNLNDDTNESENQW